MTDKFMSGWGLADRKTNKLVFICDSYEQASIVADNALARTDMRYININTTKPYYNNRAYYTQFKTIEDCRSWYKPGYFNNVK